MLLLCNELCHINCICYCYIVYLHYKKVDMWTEMSNPAILIKLGFRIKETRLRKGIQQEELAIQAGVSLFTVAKIEKGLSVTLTMLLSVLRALELLENIEQLIPEPRVSPILLKKLQGRTIHRVRRKNNKP